MKTDVKFKMILSDTYIKNRLRNPENGLMVYGVNDWDKQLQPTSIDLRLSNDFSTPHPQGHEDREIWETEQLVLEPGDFVLGTTVETIRLPNDLCGMVKDRSSIGRLGINVQTAGWVDAGFEGELTLEIKNQSNRKVTVPSGTRVCQLVLMHVAGTPQRTYGEKADAKYQNQTGATPSKLGQ